LACCLAGVARGPPRRHRRVGHGAVAARPLRRVFPRPRAPVVRPNRNKSFFYRNFMTKLKISLCEVAILLLHKNNEVEINFTFFKFELVKSRLFDSPFLKLN
jgi:hypothetical protein